MIIIMENNAGSWRAACALFLLCTSCLCSAAHAQVATQRRTGTPANNPAQGDGDWMAEAVETDSVVLQLDSDPTNSSDRRMDAQAMMLLLKSTALTDPVIEKVLGTPAAQARGSVTIDAVASSYRFVQLTAAVRPGTTGAKAGTAKAIVQQVCDRLRAAVEQSGKAAMAGYEARRKALEADLAEAKQRLDKATAALRAARAAGGSVGGPFGSGYAGGGSDPRYLRQNLMQQKQQLELQLAGSRAQLKSLEESAKAATTAPAPGAGSQAPASLGRLVDLRTRRLDEVKSRAANKQATDAQVEDAELALAESRALADAVSQLATLRFGQSSNPYNPASSLPSIRASIADAEARLASIDGQLSQLGPPATEPAVGAPEDINRLSNEENRARSDIDTLQMQLRDLVRNFRIGPPPTLTILDGRTNP